MQSANIAGHGRTWGSLGYELGYETRLLDNLDHLDHLTCGSQRKMDHMAKDDAARPMIDWMNSVPPGDLAAELMPAFGGGGSLDGGTIVNWLFELHGYPRSAFSSQNYPEEPGCQFGGDAAVKACRPRLRKSRSHLAPYPRCHLLESHPFRLGDPGQR